MYHRRVAVRELRRLALPVYLPSFLLSMASGVLVPILPLFAYDLSANLTLVGVALAADGIGLLLADLPAGALLRRLDRRGAMVLGIAFVALSSLALVGVHGIAALVGWRLVAGLGTALWNLSRHAYLAQATAGGTARGRAVSLFGGVNRMGSFAGPALGGVAAGLWGLGAAFVLAGVLALLALPLTLRFVARERATETGPAAPPRAPWRLLAERRALLAAAGSGVLLAQTVRAGRRVLIPLVGAHLGLGAPAIGLIVSAAAAVDTSLFLPAGWLMDRRGRKWAIVPSFALQALGMALVPLAGGSAGLLLAACVIGFGNGLGSGTMMTLGADLAPEDALGEFLAVWRLLGDGGFTLGPLIVGGVAQLLGLGPAALAVAGVGAGAAALFAFGVPETLRRGAEAGSSPP